MNARRGLRKLLRGPWHRRHGLSAHGLYPTVFTKHRDPCLTKDMSRKVMAAILAHREVARLLSDQHSRSMAL
jgi:hypothetical protein